MKQKRRRQQGERQQRRSDGETEPSEKLAISILIRNNFRLEAAETERARERETETTRKESPVAIAVEVAVEAVALWLVAWQNVKWPPMPPYSPLHTPSVILFFPPSLSAVPHSMEYQSSETPMRLKMRNNNNNRQSLRQTWLTSLPPSLPNPFLSCLSGGSSAPDWVLPKAVRLTACLLFPLPHCLPASPLPLLPASQTLQRA